MSVSSAVAESGLRANPPPTARINGAPRKIDVIEKPVTIRNKETGEQVQLSVANARDLVHNVGGWEYVKVRSIHDGEPKVVAADVPPSSTDTDPDKDTDEDDDDTAPNVSPEVAELNALRAKAAELGVDVDNRWGKKKLNEEIAKATPAA